MPDDACSLFPRLPSASDRHSPRAISASPRIRSVQPAKTAGGTFIEPFFSRKFKVAEYLHSPNSSLNAISSPRRIHTVLQKSFKSPHASTSALNFGLHTDSPTPSPPAASPRPFHALLETSAAAAEPRNRTAAIQEDLVYRDSAFDSMAQSTNLSQSLEEDEHLLQTLTQVEATSIVSILDTVSNHVASHNYRTTSSLQEIQQRVLDHPKVKGGATRIVVLTDEEWYRIRRQLSTFYLQKRQLIQHVLELQNQLDAYNELESLEYRVASLKSEKIELCRDLASRESKFATEYCLQKRLEKCSKALHRLEGSYTHFSKQIEEDEKAYEQLQQGLYSLR